MFAGHAKPKSSPKLVAQSRSSESLNAVFVMADLAGRDERLANARSSPPRATRRRVPTVPEEWGEQGPDAGVTTESLLSEHGLPLVDAVSDLPPPPAPRDETPVAAPDIELHECTPKFEVGSCRISSACSMS